MLYSDIYRKGEGIVGMVPAYEAETVMKDANLLCILYLKRLLGTIFSKYVPN